MKNFRFPQRQQYLYIKNPLTVHTYLFGHLMDIFIYRLHQKTPVQEKLCKLLSGHFFSASGICTKQCFLYRIFDTSGQEEYEQIRKGAYNATDVLFIAFSIVKRDSFLNIKRLWLREQKRFMPKVKVMASVFMLFSYYRKVLKNVTIQ